MVCNISKASVKQTESLNISKEYKNLLSKKLDSLSLNDYVNNKQIPMLYSNSIGYYVLNKEGKKEYISSLYESSNLDGFANSKTLLVPAEEAISYAKSLINDFNENDIQFINSLTNGIDHVDASSFFGKYSNGKIYIKNEDGTVDLKVLKHEMIHKIIDQYMPANEVDNLFNYVSNDKNYISYIKTRGIANNSNSIEEYIADYYASGTYNTSDSNSVIDRFIEYIKSLFSSYLKVSKTYTLEDFYKKVNTGYYQSASYNSSGVDKFASIQRMYNHRKDSLGLLNALLPKSESLDLKKTPLLKSNYITIHNSIVDGISRFNNQRMYFYSKLLKKDKAELNSTELRMLSEYNENYIDFSDDSFKSDYLAFLISGASSFSGIANTYFDISSLLVGLNNNNIVSEQVYNAFKMLSLSNDKFIPIFNIIDKKFKNGEVFKIIDVIDSYTIQINDAGSNIGLKASIGHKMQSDQYSRLLNYDLASLVVFGTSKYTKKYLKKIESGLLNNFAIKDREEKEEHSLNEISHKELGSKDIDFIKGLFFNYTKNNRLFFSYDQFIESISSIRNKEELLRAIKDNNVKFIENYREDILNDSSKRFITYLMSVIHSEKLNNIPVNIPVKKTTSSIVDGKEVKTTANINIVLSDFQLNGDDITFKLNNTKIPFSYKDINRRRILQFVKESFSSNGYDNNSINNIVNAIMNQYKNVKKSNIILKAYHGVVETINSVNSTPIVTDVELIEKSLVLKSSSSRASYASMLSDRINTSVKNKFQSITKENKDEILSYILTEFNMLKSISIPSFQEGDTDYKFTVKESDLKRTYKLGRDTLNPVGNPTYMNFYLKQYNPSIVFGFGFDKEQIAFSDLSPLSKKMALILTMAQSDKLLGPTVKDRSIYMWDKLQVSDEKMLSIVKSNINNGYIEILGEDGKKLSVDTLTIKDVENHYKREAQLFLDNLKSEVESMKYYTSMTEDKVNLNRYVNVLSFLDNAYSKDPSIKNKEIFIEKYMLSALNNMAIINTVFGDLSVFKNKADALKRMPVSLTPLTISDAALFPNSTQAEAKKKFKVAVVSNDTINLSTLFNGIDQFSEISKNSDLAPMDGATFISKSMSEHFKKFHGLDPSSQSNKNIVSSKIGEDGWYFQMKHNSCVISDDLIELYPQYAAIAKFMEDNGIDILTTPDSVKVFNRKLYYNEGISINDIMNGKSSDNLKTLELNQNMIGSLGSLEREKDKVVSAKQEAVQQQDKLNASEMFKQYSATKAKALEAYRLYKGYKLSDLADTTKRIVDDYANSTLSDNINLGAALYNDSFPIVSTSVAINSAGSMLSKIYGNLVNPKLPGLKGLLHPDIGFTKFKDKPTLDNELKEYNDQMKLFNSLNFNDQYAIKTLFEINSYIYSETPTENQKEYKEIFSKIKSNILKHFNKTEEELIKEYNMISPRGLRMFDEDGFSDILLPQRYKKSYDAFYNQFKNANPSASDELAKDYASSQIVAYGSRIPNTSVSSNKGFRVRGFISGERVVVPALVMAISGHDNDGDSLFVHTMSLYSEGFIDLIDRIKSFADKTSNIKLNTLIESYSDLEGFAYGIIKQNEEYVYDIEQFKDGLIKIKEQLSILESENRVFNKLSNSDLFEDAINEADFYAYHNQSIKEKSEAISLAKSLKEAMEPIGFDMFNKKDKKKYDSIKDVPSAISYMESIIEDRGLPIEVVNEDMNERHRALVMALYNEHINNPNNVSIQELQKLLTFREPTLPDLFTLNGVLQSELDSSIQGMAIGYFAKSLTAFTGFLFNNDIKSSKEDIDKLLKSKEFFGLSDKFSSTINLITEYGSTAEAYSKSEDVRRYIDSVSLKFGLTVNAFIDALKEDTVSIFKLNRSQLGRVSGMILMDYPMPFIVSAVNSLVVSAESNDSYQEALSKDSLKEKKRSSDYEDFSLFEDIEQLEMLGLEDFHSDSSSEERVPSVDKYLKQIAYNYLQDIKYGNNTVSIEKQASNLFDKLKQFELEKKLELSNTSFDVLEISALNKESIYLLFKELNELESLSDESINTLRLIRISEKSSKELEQMIKYASQVNTLVNSKQLSFLEPAVSIADIYSRIKAAIPYALNKGGFTTPHIKEMAVGFIHQHSAYLESLGIGLSAIRSFDDTLNWSVLNESTETTEIERAINDWDLFFTALTDSNGKLMNSLKQYIGYVNTRQLKYVKEKFTNGLFNQGLFSSIEARTMVDIPLGLMYSKYNKALKDFIDKNRELLSGYGVQHKENEYNFVLGTEMDVIEIIKNRFSNNLDTEIQSFLSNLSLGSSKSFSVLPINMSPQTYQEMTDFVSNNMNSNDNKGDLVKLLLYASLLEVDTGIGTPLKIIFSSTQEFNKLKSNVNSIDKFDEKIDVSKTQKINIAIENFNLENSEEIIVNSLSNLKYLGEMLLSNKLNVFKKKTLRLLHRNISIRLTGADAYDYLNKLELSIQENTFNGVDIYTNDLIKLNTKVDQLKDEISKKNNKKEMDNNKKDSSSFISDSSQAVQCKIQS